MKFIVGNYTNNQTFRNKKKLQKQKYNLNIMSSYLSKVNNGYTKARCVDKLKVNNKDTTSMMLLRCLCCKP